MRGVKVEDVKRGRRFQRLNVIGGLCNGETLAEFCYNGTTTGDFFEMWFSDCLLKHVEKGCTVIMDNASFHRKNKLRELAEKAGIELLFLPPYSPDFNPIEKTWANMKRALRDLLPLCKTLAEAVYLYFGGSIT